MSHNILRSRLLLDEPTTLHSGLDPDALWYKDAIIYEVHVRAFYDSKDDGMGDFRGLTRKLDYLQDLGVTASGCCRSFPPPGAMTATISPTTPMSIPAYGTLRDFQTFLKKRTAADLRVITEVVLNHTSDQHPWFQRSRRAPPGSRWRDFYVWSDTPDKYRTRASSSKISKPPTGPGTRSQRLITGIASIRISPI